MLFRYASAFAEGLKTWELPGDVLLSVDGHATPSWDAYVAAREASGESIRLRLFRDGVELEVEVPLLREPALGAVQIATVLGLLDRAPAVRENN